MLIIPWVVRFQYLYGLHKVSILCMFYIVSIVLFTYSKYGMFSNQPEINTLITHAHNIILWWFPILQSNTFRVIKSMIISMAKNKRIWIQLIGQILSSPFEAFLFYFICILQEHTKWPDKSGVKSFAQIKNESQLGCTIDDSWKKYVVTNSCLMYLGIRESWWLVWHMPFIYPS